MVKAPESALLGAAEIAVGTVDTVAINDSNQSLYKFYKARKNRRSFAY